MKRSTLLRRAKAFPALFSRGVRCDLWCCTQSPQIRKLDSQGAEDGAVKAQQRVILKCNAKGNPNPVFKWLKDGDEVKARKGLKIRIGKRSSRLVIRNATVGDEGIYTCVAMNAVGEDRKNIELKVRSLKHKGMNLKQAHSMTATK
ncbi:pro-neuregulin-2, membrane-bound isoform, partial [Plakobranchus ocellatus]